MELLFLTKMDVNLRSPFSPSLHIIRVVTLAMVVHFVFSVFLYLYYYGSEVVLQNICSTLHLTNVCLIII